MSSSSNNNSNNTPATTNFANNATLWLLIWTANNVGVTLLNKAAFSTVKFNYPFFLSAIHMLICWLGAQLIFLSINHSNSKRNSQQQLSLSLSTTIPQLQHKELDIHSNSKNETKTNNSQQSTTIPTSSINTNTNTSIHKVNIIEQILGTGIHRVTLDKSGNRLIFIFSIIFSLNIAIGNVSLKYVSVNFNQVMRSLVPAITIGMGICLGKPVSTKRIIAVVPIIIGVAFACFGDMSYTTIGFVTTVACIVLAALKVVASGELLSGNKVTLHPVDLLAHMAPLSLIQCLVLSILSGELYTMKLRWGSEFPFGIITNVNSYYPTFVVLSSGLLSFSLNICSLQANKLTSPLTLCIAANVKQVLMIAVSTIIFGTIISPLNGIGIFIVLLGSARYSYISLVEKETKSSIISSSSSNTNIKLATSPINNNVEMKSLLSDTDDNLDSTTNTNNNNSNHVGVMVRRNHSNMNNMNHDNKV